MRAHDPHPRHDRPRAARARRIAVGLPAVGLAAALTFALAGAGLPAGASGALAVARLPRPGGPVAGASVSAAPRDGSTRVFWPGDGWLVLGGAASLPLGTTFDAAAGTVLIMSARDAAGAMQRVDVSGGAFAVTQTVGPSPVTRFTLYSGRAPACTSSRSHAVVRRLWADGDGRLQVVAANVTATVTQSTDWMVADRCDGTELSVRSGSVLVRRTRSFGFGHRVLERVGAGATVLFAGPPPGASPALPAVRAGHPHAPGAGQAGPTSTSTTVTSATSTTTSTAPAVPPQQQLDTLVATVNALGLSGQAGSDLIGDLQAAQTALTFGTTAATCTALGTVGQAIFENASAPSGAISAATATSLLSATDAIGVAIGCSTPDARDLTASNELLGAIGELAILGLDPSTASGLAAQIGQAGQAIVVGDETDGCSAVEFLSEAIGLVEAGGSGSGSLTLAQGQAISGKLAPVESQLSCSSAAPSGL